MNIQALINLIIGYIVVFEVLLRSLPVTYRLSLGQGFQRRLWSKTAVFLEIMHKML